MRSRRPRQGTLPERALVRLDKTVVGGANWTLLSDPRRIGETVLAIRPHREIVGGVSLSEVLVATTSGVFVSTNGGDTFRKVSGQAIPAGVLNDALVNPS